MPYIDVHAGSCDNPLAMCTGCNIRIVQDDPTSEKMLLWIYIHEEMCCEEMIFR